jgi:hypothetical protein
MSLAYEGRESEPVLETDDDEAAGAWDDADDA